MDVDQCFLRLEEIVGTAVVALAELGFDKSRMHVLEVPVGGRSALFMVGASDGVLF